MDGHREPKVEEQAQILDLGVSDVAVPQIVDRAQGAIGAELVSVEDAFDGETIIGEVDGGLVPMLVEGFDLFYESAHAIEDGCGVSETDDEIALFGFEGVAGGEIEVFSNGVSIDQDPHVEPELVVGLCDEWEDVALLYESDVFGLGPIVDFSALPNVCGELDDGVTCGLPVDLVQGEIRGRDGRLVFNRLELPGVPDRKDGQVVVFEVGQHSGADHTGFVEDDASDAGFVGK